MKKILRILLCVFFVVALIIPNKNIVAAEVYTGKCGDNLTWTINTGTGVMTISGSGEMTNAHDPDWHIYGKYVTKVVFQNGITSIGNCSYGGGRFDQMKITSIELPSSVVTIASMAFADMDYLETITIPESVKSIGQFAFAGCPNLKVVNYNAINATCGDGIFNGSGADIGGFALNIGANVTHIPSYFVGRANFYNAIDSVKTVKFLGNKVISIGDGAFRFCNLDYIELPSSIRTIGKSAFASYSGSKILDAYYLGSSSQWKSNVTVGSNNTALTDVLRFHESHSYGNTTVIKIPTCTAQGQQQRICSVCGYKQITNTNSLGHSYGNWSVVKQSSCSELGQQKRICTTCGNIEYNDITKKEHTVLDKNDWHSDGQSHWLECNECSAKVDTTNHVYDNACDTTCNTCGYVRTITHTYKTTWSSDASKHWHECSVCGVKKDATNHVYDNACDTTCNTCGYVRTITHTYKTTWSGDASKHWHECSVCGVKKDATNHVYDNACDTTCNTCGYVRTITHTYKTTWSSDASKHWHECSVCGVKKDATNHVYDNACDTTCNTCGYVRTITHTYKTTWSGDASKHWHECSVCGVKKDATNHVYDNACDTTCNTCGYVRTITHTYKTTWSSDASKHWHECSVCGVKKDTTNHVYDNACDTTCNTCGYVRTITHTYKTTWSSDASKHWHECSVCGVKKDETNHVYDNACDTTCNFCGAKRSVNHLYKAEWTADITKHWYECTICGNRKEESAHVPGALATEYEPQICNVCEYVINSALGHTCCFSDEWNHNREEHWYACTGCNQRKNIEKHSYDNGCDMDCNVCGFERIVTHQYDNKWVGDETQHWYSCIVCDYKTNVSEHAWDVMKDDGQYITYSCSTCNTTKKEKIIITENNTQDSISTETKKPAYMDKTNQNRKNSYLLGSIGIVVVVAVVVGVAIVTKCKKKK